MGVIIQWVRSSVLQDEKVLQMDGGNDCATV